MKKSALFLFILFISLIACNSGKISQRKQYKLQSKNQIEVLKNGVLLVRLKTSKSVIDALHKIGKVQMAEKKQSIQQQENKAILESFREDFNFCPVYFFYSDYSIEVRKKEFEKVVFLNDSLEPDSSIKVNTQNFLTAEVGRIRQDTAKYYDSQRTAITKDGMEKHTIYYGGSNMGFEALLIMSDQFIQLSNPFPYYVRTYDSVVLKRSMTNTVDIMNQKLHEFYEKSRKWD